MLLFTYGPRCLAAYTTTRHGLVAGGLRLLHCCISTCTHDILVTLNKLPHVPACATVHTCWLLAPCWVLRILNVTEKLTDIQGVLCSAAYSEQIDRCPVQLHTPKGHVTGISNYNASNPHTSCVPCAAAGLLCMLSMTPAAAAESLC